MHVIPVIDVRGGVTVAAARGDRSRYRPLESPLSASPDPVPVVGALHGLFPFPTLYVADLDGIEGRGADLAMQSRIAAAWPGREIWIDDGTAGLRRLAGDPHSPGPFLPANTGGAEHGARPRMPTSPEMKVCTSDAQPSQKRVSHVIGSESLESLADYERAQMRAGPDAPLSLDFRGETFVGPPDLYENAVFWPRRIIVMTLARVGSGEGPDRERLANVIARAGGRRVFAAGGVRSAEDLKALRDMGVAGALISTALHQRAITGKDLDALRVERDVF